MKTTTIAKKSSLKKPIANQRPLKKGLFSSSKKKVESNVPVMEVDKDGNKYWMLNGKLHREDGPAIECANGRKEWLIRNKLHREDGPAIELANGDKNWYLQGKNYTETEWKKKVATMKKKAASTSVSTPKVDATQPVMEVDKDGNKRWELNGKYHREDGPAIESANGDKYWYLHGKYHREDGPAVEFATGSKFWYLHGQLHREDGPAVEFADGYKEWYLRGQRHREDGPAIENVDGTKRWYLQDIYYTEAEWKKIVASIKKAASTSVSTPKVDATQPVMEVDRVGTKRWKLNGQLHREDGPAIEHTDGSKSWYLQNKEYTEAQWKKKVAAMKKTAESTSASIPKVESTQPVMEVDQDGTKYWKLNGKYHREDGPAVEYVDGGKQWYRSWWRYGQRHREDGPAVEWHDGDKNWFLQGKEYTEAQWKKKVAAIKKKAESISASTPKSVTPDAPSPSMMDHIKSDLSQGTFRVAAKTIPKTARTALLAFLKAKKVKKSWLISAEEMMSTEWGLAFIQQALAWSFRTLPQLKEDPRATALADEWAIDSIAVMGNEVMAEVMTFINPILTQVLTIEPQVRIATSLPETLESQELSQETDNEGLFHRHLTN